MLSVEIGDREPRLGGLRGVKLGRLAAPPPQPDVVLLHGEQALAGEGRRGAVVPLLVPRDARKPASVTASPLACPAFSAASTAPVVRQPTRAGGRAGGRRPRSGLAADELAQALSSGGVSATWRLQNPVRGAGMSGSSRVLVAAQRRSCRLVRSGFTNQASRRAWRGAVRCVEAGRGRGRARRDAEGARCGKRRLSGGRCWLGVRGRIEGMEAGSSLWAVVWECRDGVWRRGGPRRGSGWAEEGRMARPEEGAGRGIGGGFEGCRV